MAAYVAGDAAAFRQLFERLSPVLRRTMRWQLLDLEEANDLVQQTFLQLHRSRNDFAPGAKLRPWLFTIAINLKREHFRRVRRRSEIPLDPGGRHDPALGPRAVEQVDAQRKLLRGLSRLSREQREAIVLHWLEGLTFAEVAQVVGASANSVKVRAHRGYVVLREVLAERAHSTPGAASVVRAPVRPRSRPQLA